MGALAAVSVDRLPAGAVAADEWAEVAADAPQLAATVRRYLTQSATFLAPRSVDAAETALRQLARWLLANTDIDAVADIARNDIEDFKVWLADQPGNKGKKLAVNTVRQRLRMLRVFFERIIEWDWPDAPMRNPIIGRDIPPRPEPLPQFLDDRDDAKLMAAARSAPDPRDRVVVEVLARTGLRAGELCDLEADAVVRIGDGHWLRVPLGKLRNDRYVPLHPQLVELLATWVADNLNHIRHHHRLIADGRGPLSRDKVVRIVRRVGRSVDVDVHPHRLRHTLATQAINRGMRLEAIAALYGQDLELPADYETTTMAKLRREAHARMLGNGLCTRPAELDCRMESACETCSYFSTGPQFVPVLIRQRDHARDHDHDRADLFDRLIEGATEEGA